MAIRDYRDLEVWQHAMELVTLIYLHTKQFPKDEIYGLTNQLRRAAVSVPSNIAEGQGRRTAKDFLSFLFVARGSIQEVQTQIEIASRLGYFDLSKAELLGKQATCVVRLLNGLISALNRKLEP